MGRRRARVVRSLIALGAMAGLLALAPSAAWPAGPPVVGDELGLGSLAGGQGPLAESKVAISARLVGSTTPRRATLLVTAQIAPLWHIYSITQKPGGPVKTTIELTSSTEYRLAGGFTAMQPPKVHMEEFWPGLAIEEHEGLVTWSAPVELAAGANPARLVVEGTVKGQVCQAICEDFRVAFSAKYSPPENVGRYRAGNSHAEISGHVAAEAVSPGETVKLYLTAAPDADWHVYPLADREPEGVGARPTLIVLTGEAARLAGKPKTDAAVAKGPLGPHHEGPVTWTIDLAVPAEAKPGSSASR
jgi:hypothetical protein